MDTISFTSHGTRCEASYLRATSERLTTVRGRPCVVMAHGFGATRDSGLLPFAERFAAAGADVLVFDYRGFGTSGGTPRQDVDHRRHREDYHAAIAAARAHDGVDPDRIVLWGTSYSGGHVIAVAAADPRVAGLISQGAAMDGLVAVLDALRMTAAGGRPKVLALALAVLRDLGRAVTRRTPYLVPLVGPEGSIAAIAVPGADAGFRAVAGPGFRNEMCARGLLRIPLNRPVRRAVKVTCPALVVIAEHDNIAPVSASRRVVRILGARAETLSLECGHFDLYAGRPFEDSVARQVGFLLSAAGRDAPRAPAATADSERGRA